MTTPSRQVTDVGSIVSRQTPKSKKKGSSKTSNVDLGNIDRLPPYDSIDASNASSLRSVGLNIPSNKKPVNESILQRMHRISIIECLRLFLLYCYYSCYNCDTTCKLWRICNPPPISGDIWILRVKKWYCLKVSHRFPIIQWCIGIAKLVQESVTYQ